MIGPFSKSIKIFFIAALFAGALSGCALNRGLQSVTPYLSKSYGREESAANYTRFKLVDNFASRDLKNAIGGTWWTEAPEGSEVKIDYAEEEAVSRYGFALEVKYSLPPNGRAAVVTDLNGLDISRARAVSLWFEYSARREAKIKIRLTDRKNRVKEVDATGRLDSRSKNWQELLIPVRSFWPVDFNQLQKLEIIVQSQTGEEGAFLLDHLAFFGPEDVFFESLKDNLKGFPRTVDVDRGKLQALGDEELLKQIAADTWRYFDNIVDRRHNLPLDRIKLSWRKEIGDYTSPTNIGLYYLAVISARELGLISGKEAEGRLSRSLKTVEKLSKWKGFLYNYYSTTNLSVTTPFVSTVDNGWLCAALFVVREFFPGPIGKKADKIIREMDFYELYDPGEGKFNLGYDAAAQKFSNSHYGLLVSEARMASFIAMAKGDVEIEHWYRLARVLPRSWRWQNQIPKGKNQIYRAIRVFEGYYAYGDRKFVPSWGGSIFEFLMPTLLMKERELAPSGLGMNNLIAAEIHRDYALSKKRYPVWGIAPCMVDRGARGVYEELGVKEVSVKGYKEKAVITPYASILALELLPEDVMINIRRLINLYPVYGEYGFYDSVSLRKPMVTKQYLALDQAMILISIANDLKNGFLRERFHNNQQVQKIQSLLSEEKFFAA